MPVKLIVDVLAPDDVLRDYGAGSVLRYERSAAVGGSFVEQGTKPILAATYQYEIFDATGSDALFYRTRYSNAAATVFSDYDPVFSPGSPGSYASLDDLLLAVRQNITDTRWLANARQRLGETTRDLTREIGYSFAKTSETWRIHGKGDRRLHLHEGVVSLSLVEIQLTTGGTFVALAAGDYYLEGRPGEDYIRPGEPFFHLVLEQDAAYRTFPAVERGVRLTGVRGWPAILSDHRAANIAWARQKLAADTSLPGGPIGPDEFGNPVGPDRWPRAVYDLVMSERGRHWCWF